METSAAEKPKKKGEKKEKEKIEAIPLNGLSGNANFNIQVTSANIESPSTGTRPKRTVKKEFPSTSRSTGARPKRTVKKVSVQSGDKLEDISKSTSTEDCTKRARKRISRFFHCLPSREKCSNEDSCQKGGKMIQVGGDISLDYSKQLRPGYHVYEGIQKPETGKKEHSVAVKIYHIADGSDWITSYCQEVDNMCSLTGHDHVAEYIHSASVKTDGPWNMIYIAIRLYHKMTLADILPCLMELESKARHRIATGIFRQICHGVKHLHNNNPQIAHMDLKPTNILFSTNGKRAIVSDFSISREVDIKRTKEANQTTITKSNSSYGGTQGWKPAEMFQSENNAGKPNFLKADNFSLGLVGCHIFCNKHPFRNSKRPTDSALWHSNIIEEKPPKLDNLETTDDGPVVVDLFEKMLCHVPDERPNVEEVLSHFLFWDAGKRMKFILDMNQLYEDLLDPEDEDEEWMKSEELVVAFFGVDEPTCSVKTAMTEDDVAHGKKKKKKKKKEKEDDRAAHSTSPAKIKALEEAFARIPKSNRIKILAEFGAVISEDFLEKIQNSETSPYKKERVDADKTDYRVKSLANLLRLIRNYQAHRVKKDVKKKSAETWKYWSSLFPKLLPLLYRITKREFTEEHETEYKSVSAVQKIDVKHLLEKAETSKQLGI